MALDPNRYPDPASLRTGQAAVNARTAAQDRITQIADELEAVNQRLYGKGFKNRDTDITVKWGNKGVEVDGQRMQRNDVTTASGKLVRDLLAEHAELDEYVDTMEKRMAPPIRDAMIDIETRLGTAVEPGPVLPPGLNPTPVTLYTDEYAASLLRYSERPGLGDIMGIDTAAGQSGAKALRVHVGDDPFLSRLIPEESKLMPSGQVGSMNDAAARRLATFYANTPKIKQGINFQQMSDRLFFMNQSEINRLADQMFAAGYLSPANPSSYDWTRSYSSQTLNTADTLLPYVGQLWAEVARSPKGTTISSKMQSRIKANAGEMERLRKNGEQSKAESAQWLAMTADTVARQTLGRSLGGAWNARTMAPLADRMASGQSVGGTDVEAATRLAIQGDPDLLANEEAYNAVNASNSISRFLRGEASG